jgi:hypothetical protein
MQARVSEWSLSILPSPIPELQHAPTPFSFDVSYLGLTFEPLKELGVRHL